MQFIFETLIPILEGPVGIAFYALLLLFLLSIVYLVLNKRAEPDKLDTRINIGLGVLMGLRLIELPIFIQAWMGEPAALQAMPAIERGVHIISLVILAWLWTRSGGEGGRKQLLFAVELLTAVTVALALISVGNDLGVGAAFNYTTIDYVWSGTSLFILFVSVYQIFSSGQAGQRLGFLQLGMLVLGHGLHLILAEPNGQMPLLVEVANLIAIPLLVALPIKMQSAKRETRSTPSGPAPTEQPAFTMPAFFDLEELSPAAERPPSQPAEELAKQIAEEFGADLGLLATLNEAQLVLELEYGYNLLRSAPVEMTRIPLREVPRLASALMRSRSLRLSADQRLSELASLSQALRLSFPGHLLAAPFTHPRDLRRWALLLINLERNWQLEDEVNVEKAVERLGAKLARAMGISEEPIADTAAPVKEELSRAKQEAESLAVENHRYREDINRLLAHIDELERGRAELEKAESNEVVTALQVENEKLKQAMIALQSARPSAKPTLQVEQAKEELRLAMEEVAGLQARLDAAQQAMLDAGVQETGNGKVSASQVELIASIAQELRQPLSSVLGYTDLLLGESVGILGALQRKFLERVRNSTERMNKLIDDLIRIAHLDSTGQAVTRKPVDLNSVIDDAISLLRTQLQEKRIALRVDLPRQMPQLNTDRDALQQILYHLLQNADAATPAQGAITLRALAEEQAELGEYVLIQVSDSGGGIPEEDLARVFSRVYRATNPVIQGVGDTGVGLTIAETLTQALGGRIWVESEQGVGATFSVLLPMQPPGLENGEHLVS